MDARGRLCLYLMVYLAQGGTGAWAQQPKSSAQTGGAAEAFKTQTLEVIVPVTVTDEKGRFVTDLDQKDFHILDEGKEQQIRFFSRERNQPVVVGFLLDLSNASRLYWKNYKEAAIELVLNLLSDEKKYSGYLISYADSAELQVNTTTESDPIVAKLEKLRPGGGSSLFDAIYVACTTRKLVQGEPVQPRRVIVIIGDGHDNHSQKTLKEVVEVAQRNLVTVYAVSTVGYGFVSEGTENLTRLAEETGGRVVYPLQNLYQDVSGYLGIPSDEGNYALKVGTGAYAAEIASGMFKAIANVAGEVTTQYILRYVPNNVDGKEKGFRSVQVRVDLPGVRIRARKGYYPYGAPVSR